MEFIFWQFEQMWVKYDSAVNNNVWKTSNIDSHQNEVKVEEKEILMHNKLTNRKKSKKEQEKNIIFPWKKIKNKK